MAECLPLYEDEWCHGEARYKGHRVACNLLDGHQGRCLPADVQPLRNHNCNTARCQPRSNHELA